jgi:hypothetical protein
MPMPMPMPTTTTTPKRPSTPSTTRYFFTKYRLADSERTVNRYYKFVRGANGRDRSVWVSQEEAEGEDAVERGGIRTLRASSHPERLDETQYVCFVQERVKAKGRTGNTRLSTQAVGRDGKYYKANEQEALDSGLPLVPKLEGLQTWYVRRGRKHKYASIRALQDEFWLRHKANAKQRREGLLSYEPHTYVMKTHPDAAVWTDHELDVRERRRDRRDADADSDSDSDADADADDSNAATRRRHPELSPQPKPKPKPKPSPSPSPKVRRSGVAVRNVAVRSVAVRNCAVRNVCRRSGVAVHRVADTLAAPTPRLFLPAPRPRYR